MKVLTTGSRDWTGIWGAMRITGIMSQFLGLSAWLQSPLRLMNGACPEGADAAVKRWAERNGVPVEEFPADWLKLGKRAGPIRNQHMVSLGADMCVAFLKDGSRGTQGTIDLARAAGIPTFVIPWQSPEDDLPLLT